MKISIAHLAYLHMEEYCIWLIAKSYQRDVPAMIKQIW